MIPFCSFLCYLPAFCISAPAPICRDTFVYGILFSIYQIYLRAWRHFGVCSEVTGPSPVHQFTRG
jgi:hypothetical protein